MSAAAVALPQEIWKPRANPWLIAIIVSLAAFMEVLDTSIANVALPHIAGNLGASNDQSTWVLTSYLVANAIVLPISGWLVTVFGRKRFFMTCLGIFTACSPWCKRFSLTLFLPKSAAWLFRCTASPQSARRRSGQPWAAG
jgi:DHA2 family multidrug resistance protein